MVGRRRRGSTSSVEATSRRVHWCKEASVVRTPEPGTPEDEWPVFELKDAVVLNMDGETMENALDVLFRGPFIIRGRMVLEDVDQKRHLIIKVKSSLPIEISTCTRYSVGEADDDVDESDIDTSRRSRAPILWLSGRGAWFEINPSAAYLPIYRDICEAIRLYYAIYDIYSTQTAKVLNRLSKSTDPIERLSEVFFQYAVKVGNGLTVEEVAQMCRDLAPFFISQFLQSDAEKFWQETFFYRWIIKENEDLFKRAKQAIRSPPKAIIPSISHELPSRSKRGTSDSISGSSAPESQEPVTRNRSTRSRSTAQESASKNSGANESISSKHTKTTPQSTTQHAGQTERVDPSPPNSIQDPDVPPTRRNDQSAFDAVLESVEWAYNQLAITKKGITKTGLLNKLYFTYKFPNYRNGKPGCHHIPVEEVLHYNASALIDALDASKWEGNDFYPWLKKMAKTEFKPEAIKLSDLPHRMSLRGSRPYQPRGPNTSFPQLAQVVTGGSSHQGDNDDNTSLDELETSRRGRGKGVKTPGRLGKSSLRPAASSKKRPRPDVDSGSDSESRDAKRSHYFSDADDTMEDADTSDHGTKEEEEDYVKIVLRADKIPSAVPRGPNETWTCDQDDCDYIVRGDDAEECQERIQVHFKEHEEQTERVQLALTESRGHMPINHLLDKIKQLGDRAELEEELSMGGIALPRPIQRKLIV